ncbi:hypothetical protein RFF05_12725 [Bengtsoniella intestinalis]|uniref:hypothetical protein n=1 Tax=Bengtsoniella intestinalis TaxID=3073143 RepID=UPI00391F3A04
MGKSILAHAVLPEMEAMLQIMFEKVDLEHLELVDRTLAWNLAQGGDKESIQLQINEYNAYVSEVENNVKFVECMKCMGGCIKKSDAIEHLGEDFTTFLFGLKAYSFRTQMSVDGEWFVLLGASVDCHAEVDGVQIAFSIGGSDCSYPLKSGDNTCWFLWDWSWDLRDFTAYLYQIFEEVSLLPEGVDENGDDLYDYGHYDCYSQAREVMTAPNENLLECMEKLEDAGYLTKYSLECPQAQGWFKCLGRQDGSLGFAMLHEGFIENAALVEKLRLLLAR